jgi:hypothetical protein
MNQVILLEDGWKRLKEGGVQKIEQILESVQGGDYKSGITTEEYSSLYTTVYTMCTQKPPNNWSEHLYNNYCDAVKDYLSARILPRIKEKHDEGARSPDASAAAKRAHAQRRRRLHRRAALPPQHARPRARCHG